MSDTKQHQLRPRLDKLVWILVTKVIPSYLVRAQVLDDGHRIGHSKSLSPFHKQFKALWKALPVLPISIDADKKYITRLDKWTCTCESLKFHSCHLCKHLVQGVPPPPPCFWTEVVSRRTVPLYRHPALVPIGEESSAYIETIDGSITDRDDHGWSGNPEMLEGEGGWRNLDFTTPSLLGKRVRSPDAGSDDTADMEETHHAIFLSSEAQDSDDEEEVEGYAQDLLRRADAFQKVAEILRAQVPHGNRLWMSSIVKRDIGQDVSLMVADINRHELTAQTRDTTWPKKGDKEGQRRSQNTMGYQVGL
ncbi:hypothetical protein B0H17DRAFT_1138976 [Mycena rosella]|uniref:SWIM-type domain-containing protein n=1 Tax=Mycena rosella TaxID=1033263 RepID=A0AAD7G944_MYCRO|nr:hypothetical protein B0H17DRAFT_1138976 [Mycena rosella]